MSNCCINLWVLQNERKFFLFDVGGKKIKTEIISIEIWMMGKKRDEENVGIIFQKSKYFDNIFEHLQNRMD